jgi:hypothetical protein
MSYDPPDYDYYYDEDERLREQERDELVPELIYLPDDELTTAEKVELEAQDSLMEQPRGCYFSSNGDLSNSGGIEFCVDDRCYVIFTLKEARWLRADLAVQIRLREAWENITGGLR